MVRKNRIYVSVPQEVEELLRKIAAELQIGVSAVAEIWLVRALPDLEEFTERLSAAENHELHEILHGLISDCEHLCPFTAMNLRQRGRMIVLDENRHDHGGDHQ